MGYNYCDNTCRVGKKGLVTELKNKLLSVLEGKSENHILPFFWQHGEDDDIILEELHRIHASGVRSLCIESRPHEGFAGESWFEDVRLIFDECRKLGIDRVLMTCDDNNIGSAKSIENNGGILENKLESDGTLVRRYWIN